MAISILAHAQGETIFDLMHSDSLVLKSKSQYEERAFPKLNAYEEIDYGFFSFLDSTLEKYRTEELQPFFLKKWNDSSYAQAINEKAKKRWLWIRKASQMLEEYDDYSYVYEMPKVLITDLSLVPISLMDGKLTFAELALFEFQDFDSEGEMDLKEFHILDLNKKEFSSLNSSKSLIDPLSLKKAIANKWESLTNDLPLDKMAYHRIYGAAPLLGEQDLDTNYIDLYNGLSNFFSNPLLHSYEYYWSGVNLMVRFPEAIEGLFPVDEFDIQIGLNSTELNNIFMKGHPYASIPNKDLKETNLENFNLYQFNNKIITQSFLNNHIDYAYASKNIKKIEQSFQQYSTANVQQTRRMHYNNNGLLTKSYYQNSREFHLDSIYWEGDQVGFHMQGKGGSYTNQISKLTRGYISRPRRDKSNNMLDMTMLSDEIKIDEYYYSKTKFVLFKYDIISPYWEDSWTINWLTIQKNGWCDPYNCIILNKFYKRIKQGDTRYLYDKDQKLLQTVNQRSYTLFEYDTKARLAKVMEYRDEILNRTFIYFYEQEDQVPYLIEEKHPQDKEPRKHINKIYYR